MDLVLAPADAVTESLRTMTSGFVASLWWRTARRPDGTWLVLGGGWCQGVGSFDLWWTACPTKAECCKLYKVRAAAMLLRPPEQPLSRVQLKAQKDLLARLDRLRTAAEFG